MLLPPPPSPRDDVAAAMSDLSCSYGLKNAYSMPIEWTEVGLGGLRKVKEGGE